MRKSLIGLVDIERGPDLRRGFAGRVLCRSAEQRRGGPRGAVSRATRPHQPRSPVRVVAVPKADVAEDLPRARLDDLSANVSRLAQTWRSSSPESRDRRAPYGLLAESDRSRWRRLPQDLDSNVYALALATGRMEWNTNAISRAERPDEWRCRRRRNGLRLTPTGAFASTDSTGQKIWIQSVSSAKAKGPSASSHGRQWTRLPSQPIRLGPGGGVLLALNASSGAALWRFTWWLAPNRACRRLGSAPAARGRRRSSAATGQ